MDVRRDCVRFAQLEVVGWVTCYPRGYPPWNEMVRNKLRTLRGI